MKHLIIYTHPNPNSFNHAILETVAGTARDAGDDVVIRDLYELNWEPVLGGSDLVSFKSGGIPDDIRREQEFIRGADVITFIYPVWWAGMPALLKGYIDRVMSYGFAYQYGAAGPEGLLKGKRAVLFTTQGTPNEMYDASGMTSAMTMTSDTGIFTFCGIEVANHTFFGGVPTVDDATRKGMLDQVKQVVRSLSPAGVAQS